MKEFVFTKAMLWAAVCNFTKNQTPLHILKDFAKIVKTSFFAEKALGGYFYC